MPALNTDLPVSQIVVKIQSIDMKRLLPLLCLLACATKPMLHKNACYELDLPDTLSPNIVHVMMNFKVVDIFDYKNKQYYAFEELDTGDGQPSNYQVKDEALKGDYGVANVQEFDKYISITLTPWTSIYSGQSSVQCEDTRDEE